MTLTVTSEEALARHIYGRLHPERATIVAVSGYGGAGKSTLAARLAAALGGAAVVPVDDFWLPERDARSSDWSAYDWPRLREQVLEPARRGDRVLRYQPLDPRDALAGSGDGERAWREVAPVAALIVEGVGLLRPDLLPDFDVTVWIDCPLEVAAERGILRDRAEYGIETAADWRERWVPNDRDFFARFRPDLAADFLYSNA